MQSQPPVEFTDEIKSLFVEKNLLKARERLLDTLANNWNGHNNLIAFTYLYAGDRSEDDCNQAMHWLEKGVLAGEVDAKVILGRLLISGELGQSDFQRGKLLLEEAANNNVLMAVLTLVQIHHGGVEGHLEADTDKAMHYTRQAAELGDPNSAYRLALELERAEAPDLANAFKYFDKAAQGGLSQAMHNVGVYYLHGKGVSKSVTLALAYLAEATKLGSPLSMLTLALLYLDGVEVPKDRGVALSWLYIYQILFPETDIPEQLQLLLDEVSVEEQNFARAAAQNFMTHQLNKSPTGTLH
ncbi:tetratricopeptide repeat protein [Limnobacter parvus]|uniref:Sel1 repeat family protein n=1 Tax=Limnobacter parvus TaxID=2939690 RepID=A0ABT1XK18_9BURK|nr:tetratricopeptide repeat protein [Limnobacter parvus]MCR2747642.1 sel1 repeat family protein [Limnobacter parvus]